MITAIETVGPAIWRASWQAAALAILVMVLLRCLGERLAPRWRFLLWGVVLTRLLLVITPASPWSAFNLVSRRTEAGPRPIVAHQTGETSTPAPESPASTAIFHQTSEPSSRVADFRPERPQSPAMVPPQTAPTSPVSAIGSPPPVEDLFDASAITRILSSVWLAGCAVLALKLLATAMTLRRRLSACRPVADTAVLDVLEACRRGFGLERAPALLVTPECLGPCIVGTLRPAIVLPESLVAEPSTERLRHVLAHELAHLVRGDLWTNWLLLSARILHWFNPVAWWTDRAMQAEREAACDELAFAALGEADRSAYASTIVELAANLGPSALGPGLIGLSSSTRRLKVRVERLVRSPEVPTLRAPIAAGLCLGTALIGLTDAMPGARAQAPKDAVKTAKEEPAPGSYTLAGRCLDNDSNAPMSGVWVRLYRIEGRTSPPVQIAQTVTDADGRFAFTRLEPPRMEGLLDRLDYSVFGFADGRPIGVQFIHYRGEELIHEVRMAREVSTISGRVIDAAGRPVVGAAVAQHTVDRGRPVPGFPSATTDADGRFQLDRVPVYKTPDGTFWHSYVAVLHPDHPDTIADVTALPADVVVMMPAGCIVTGAVTDRITGKSGAGALIMARRVDEFGETFASADAAGRFRLVIPEGRYDFMAHANDRVCLALTGRECLAGERLELPPFTLIGGGFISGRVINTATGEPVPVSEKGEPVQIGLNGPSQSPGQVVAVFHRAIVDRSGRFALRAAPGENFPYLVNVRGQRMSWDTQNQPPVVVKDGETTTYDMLITPEVTPAERLKAARELVEALPKKPSERTARILLEFRKLNHTVDQTETWCSLMRELVAVGREAVPQLCDELDRTTEDRMLRRLGFALRAIGDPRAVPALIRAIPRTLVLPSSDYGLKVGDQELTAFMQAHDLSGASGGPYFDFRRPEPEILGALHRLTGQNLDDGQLGMFLSEDPRRQVLQRRIYARQARRWQTWWEQNWRTFTDDAAYEKVHLDVADDEPMPPAARAPGKNARLRGEIHRIVLSPANEPGPHVSHFYDLDTGRQPLWPAELPRDDTARDAKPLEDWAARSGADLMCVTHRAADGTETYVLRALGMKVREITPRDVRNLESSLAAGTLPEGRPVGERLIHVDPASGQPVPDANAAFLFVTREGNFGLIEITDRVTRAANLNGLAGDPPAGAGFHRGVRFNVSTIIP